MSEEEKKESLPPSDDSPQQSEQLNTSSTDEPIASSETSTDVEPPITHNSPTVTEQDMEVHHHTHHDHGKRNWKSYFWEFLMLFLAVFCGFLAEYQLEHKIERDRAKELAKSLYEELKSDSVAIAEKSQNRIKLENSADYLMGYFKDSSLTQVSKQFVIHFHRTFAFNAPTLFEPKTIILEQLKNSGSLRYFKSEELQKLIGELTVVIDNIGVRRDMEALYRQSYIIPFLIKHFDSDFEKNSRKLGSPNLIDFIAKYENNDIDVPFTLSKPEQIDAAEVNNMLSVFSITYRGTRTIQFKKYMEVNAELLKVLRKEYHLK
jgi:hypothetical protein